MTRVRRVLNPNLGSRLTAFFIVAAVIGVPAGVLRALCVGNACESRATASSTTPFCSLPSETRSAIVQGTKEGRSGEILAVSGSTRTVGSAGTETPFAVAWPTAGSEMPLVPIVFWGNGVAAGTELPEDAALDDVAPTLAAVAGFDRPHPDVRSGETLLATGSSSVPTRLLVLIALKGIGAQDLRSEMAEWPRLAETIEAGAATLAGSAPSAAADPVVGMTTLGTGGVPAQHGITGTILRSEEGKLVEAWGSESPINVIATLGDDLDEHHSDRSTIVLVGSRAGDLGLIGGRWYSNGDRDLVSMLPRNSGPSLVADQAATLLRSSPLAKDRTPDLLGVALAGEPRQLDKAVARVIAAADDAANGAVTVAVAGMGTVERRTGDVTAASVKRQLERRLPGQGALIEAMGPGAIYVNQDELARRKVSDDVVLAELVKMKDDEGAPLFADAFPAIAVSFGRFC